MQNAIKVSPIIMIWMNTHRTDDTVHAGNLGYSIQFSFFHKNYYKTLSNKCQQNKPFH